MEMLNGEINRQAAMIAYIDDFHFMMWLTIAVLPLVFLLRKPKQHMEDGEPPLMFE
jgi:DHA2 family multidrug resistance protein